MSRDELGMLRRLALHEAKVIEAFLKGRMAMPALQIQLQWVASMRANLLPSAAS